MHLLTGFCLILAVVSISSGQSQEAILRNDFDGPNPDGSYKWAFQTVGPIIIGGPCYRENEGDWLFENRLYEFPFGVENFYSLDETLFTSRFPTIDFRKTCCHRIHNSVVCAPDDGILEKWKGGIFHEQRGALQPSSSGEPGLVVEGQYQYPAPDGQIINLLYKADENGFQPMGDHLPTPPPIPPAIARALAYLATKPPPTDSDY